MPDQFLQQAPQDWTSARAWRGLNAWLQPGDLSPGELTQADNVLVLGSNLVSRPGRQGVLTTAHAAPVYVLGAYRKADGTTACLYTSGGKLYFVNKSAAGVYDAAPTEITLAGASFALNSATAVGTRLGKYFYFADGTPAGPLYRTNLTTTTASISQNPPAAAPTVQLTSTPIDALTGGTWTSDALSGAGLTNRLPNASFTSYYDPGGLGHPIPTGWNTFAGDPDLYGSAHTYQPPGNPAGQWLLLDNPGEGILLASALANDANAADAARYATQFYAALTLYQSDPNGVASVKLGFLAYADAAGTVLLGETVREFTAPFSGNNAAATFDTVFSFASLSVPVLSYRVRLSGGSHNPLGGNSIYASQPVCFPFAAGVSAATSGAQVEVQQQQQIAYSGGTLAASNPGTVGYGKGAGGVHLTRDYGAGSPQNWSQYNAVVLGLGKAAGVTGLSLSLAFRQDGSSTRYYTNAFVVSADGLTATCDVSTVPASVRSAFRYAELVLGGDFAAPASSGNDLLLFGPLTGAGNLTIPADAAYASDYSYVYTEVNGNGDPALADVIESNPAPASAALIPTSVRAEALVTLGTASVNAATTHKALYRYGGVFVDNPAVGRLIAVVPVLADVAIGADARNPYYAWNHAAGVLTDNTPDSFILPPGVFPNAGTPLVPGRDVPPLGISALCAYHGRLMCAVGSVLSVSWLVTPTNPSAMYFTLTQTPGDPNAAVKGATFPVGGAFDNDPVQALVPLNTAVILEKMTSKAILQGYDGQTFNVQDYLKGTGVGCVAPRAAGVVQNQEVALGSSGLHGFNVAEVTPLSQAIEPLLRPKGWDGNAQIPASVFSGSCLAEHDRRLLLSAPSGPASTGNDVTYVYDTRTGGWVRWTFGATTIVSLSSGTDAGDCLLGGYDGMLYVLRGNADGATAAGASTPIAVAVRTKGFGQEGEGNYWTQDQIDYLDALLTAPAGTVVTFTATNDQGLSVSCPAFTTGAGPQSVTRLKPPNLRGFYLTVGLTASVTGPLKLTALRAELAEGRRST